MSAAAKSSMRPAIPRQRYSSPPHTGRRCWASGLAVVIVVFYDADAARDLSVFKGYVPLGHRLVFTLFMHSSMLSSYASTGTSHFELNHRAACLAISFVVPLYLLFPYLSPRINTR